MASMISYNIAVPEKKLEDLQHRLEVASFPDELHNSAWDYGTPLSDVRRLIKYWKEEYSWRKAERQLNDSLPQYMTTISCDGFGELSIHFLHQTSGKANAIPLLFSHGWPGSFLEETKIINALASGSPAFEVVVPSLPNFGFSDGVKKRGFAIEQYAEICHKLMLKLGYDKYVTQGGDWGWFVTRTMAYLYPDHCKATHFNMDYAGPPSFWEHPVLYLQNMLLPQSSQTKKGFERNAWFFETGFGYNLLQSTKPQTLAYGLNDSPVALLAWLLEKLHDWTDNYPWTDEEIITWVSVYWFSSAGPGASSRIYYEMMHDSVGNVIEPETTPSRNRMPTTKVTRSLLKKPLNNGVKIGFSHFPQDIIVLPSTYTRTLGNVVFENNHSSGGHFAAWERPQEVVEDLRSMFGKGGGAFACVPNRDGY